MSAPTNSTPHLYVILDTNAIHLDFHLLNPHTAELLQEGSKHDFVVCVSEVVVREMVADFREETIKALDLLDKLRREADRLQLRVSPDIPAIDLDAEVGGYDERFRAQLKQFNVKILDLPSVDVNQLLERGISRRKPFKNDGRGMFDALIWESVVELWRQHPDEQYALISADKEAFEERETKRIHPDLLADLDKMPIETENKTTSNEDGGSLRRLDVIVELHESIQMFNESRLKIPAKKTG